MLMPASGVISLGRSMFENIMDVESPYEILICSGTFLWPKNITEVGSILVGFNIHTGVWSTLSLNLALLLWNPYVGSCSFSSFL